MPPSKRGVEAAKQAYATEWNAANRPATVAAAVEKVVRSEEREALLAEIKESVRQELRSDEGTTLLAGNLGAAIATASNYWLLEHCTPENVANGICDWLDTRFLSGSEVVGGGEESKQERALKEIARYNADELRGWGEENAADMVEIARGAVDPPYFTAEEQKAYDEAGGEQ